MSEADAVERPPAGELEYRSATLRTVSFPDRTVELIVMPYEEETLVPWQGRMVTEVVSRGAFNGIQRRVEKIRANRDHDLTRVVGACVGLHPNRDEGLVAEIRISGTALGDETLTLANDGILDASAGFRPIPGGETWETRDRRRITKAWLGHIAFVPEPAYESARVLAVRHAANGGRTDPSEPSQVATPNLDLVRQWQRAAQLEEMYASLSR